MDSVYTTGTQRGGVVCGGPTRASDNTVYLLRSFIFTGKYEAGQKLPAERLLALQFGTSRITIRSALKELEILGFVTPKIGSRGGWWVVDSPSLTACWQNWIRINSHQIDAMLECGEVIESEIAAYAAKRRTLEELHELETLLLQMQAAGSAIGPHYVFHLALARSAGNTYLEQAMAIVGNQLFLPSERVCPDDMDEFHRSHEVIVTAIRNHNSTAARAAIKRHFRFSRHVFGLE